MITVAAFWDAVVELCENAEEHVENLFVITHKGYKHFVHVKAFNREYQIFGVINEDMDKAFVKCRYSNVRTGQWIPNHATESLIELMNIHKNLRRERVEFNRGS